MRVSVYAVVFMLLLSNASQTKVVLFTRHGARSPKVYTEIDTKYLWKIAPEDLTQKGLDMHIKLGAQFRQPSLFDSNGNCIYETLEIQASTTQRVVMSTIGFIKGLCPLNYPEIIRRYFIDFYKQYSVDDAAFAAILQSDFTDPLSLDLHHFERANDFMFHGHKNSNCAAMKVAKKDNEKNKFHVDREAEIKSQPAFDEIVTIIQEAYPSQTIKKSKVTLSDLEDLYDDYYANQVQGYNFPNPSQDAVELLKEATLLGRYFVDNSKLVEHQAQLTEPFKWLISQLYSQGTFSWYSGHDSNQVAILAVLVYDQLIIPFASALEFRIQNSLVNVYFNSTPIRTRICDSGFDCTIQETVNFLEQYIVTDLTLLCNTA